MYRCNKFIFLCVLPNYSFQFICFHRSKHMFKMRAHMFEIDSLQIMIHIIVGYFVLILEWLT